MRSRYHPILISFGKVGFFVTVQVDRCPERNALGVLKLFRLKEPEKHYLAPWLRNSTSSHQTCLQNVPSSRFS